MTTDDDDAYDDRARARLVRAVEGARARCQRTRSRARRSRTRDVRCHVARDEASMGVRCVQISPFMTQGLVTPGRQSSSSALARSSAAVARASSRLRARVGVGVGGRPVVVGHRRRDCASASVIGHRSSVIGHRHRRHRRSRGRWRRLAGSRDTAAR